MNELYWIERPTRHGPRPSKSAIVCSGREGIENLRAEGWTCYRLGLADPRVPPGCVVEDAVLTPIAILNIVIRGTPTEDA